MVDKIQLDNIALEQLVLRENFISAAGISADQVQIGIKGDPSLRETAMLRCRYESEIDRIFNDVTPVFEDLLINRGLFRLFIGFNNSEVRTSSIFDPLREEIHDASALVSADYIQLHFPPIPYAEKTKVIHQLYTSLIKSELYKYMPLHLQNLASKRHQSWQPMSEKDIHNVLTHLKVMRNLPEYYLRNFSISTVQSVVRLQFNCDGTQIVHAKDFDDFVEKNLP